MSSSSTSSPSTTLPSSSSSTATPIVSPLDDAALQTLIGTVVGEIEKDIGNLSSTNWPHYLLVAYQMAGTTLPQLSGTSKQTVALAVVQTLIQDSSLPPMVKDEIAALVSVCGPSVLGAAATLVAKCIEECGTLSCLKRVFCCCKK